MSRRSRRAAAKRSNPSVNGLKPEAVVKATPAPVVPKKAEKLDADDYTKGGFFDSAEFHWAVVGVILVGTLGSIGHYAFHLF